MQRNVRSGHHVRNLTTISFVCHVMKIKRYIHSTHICVAEEEIQTLEMEQVAIYWLHNIAKTVRSINYMDGCRGFYLGGVLSML